MSFYIGREASKVFFNYVLVIRLVIFMIVFFIIIYVWCFDMNLCSYGKEFAQRQLLRSTFLLRIGSIF